LIALASILPEAVEAYHLQKPRAFFMSGHYWKNFQIILMFF